MEDTLRERVDALSVTSTAPTPRAERASGAGGAGTASGDVRTGETTVVIGTHSGTFHCDEALACGMLLMLPEYAAGTQRSVQTLVVLHAAAACRCLRTRFNATVC